MLTYAKIACLYISFTTYEYFYKLSKMCIVPLMVPSFHGFKRTSDPTITHIYLYTCVPQIRIHTGYHFPVISLLHWHLSSFLFYITCILPVIWAYPNVNQHYSSKSQPECPSVCPVYLDFNILPVVSYFDPSLYHSSSVTSFLSQTSFSLWF